MSSRNFSHICEIKSRECVHFLPQTCNARIHHNDDNHAKSKLSSASVHPTRSDHAPESSMQREHVVCVCGRPKKPTQPGCCTRNDTTTHTIIMLGAAAALLLSHCCSCRSVSNEMPFIRCVAHKHKISLLSFAHALVGGDNNVARDARQSIIAHNLRSLARTRHGKTAVRLGWYGQFRRRSIFVSRDYTVVRSLLGTRARAWFDSVNVQV